MKLGLTLLSAVAALELRKGAVAVPTKAEVESAIKTADAAVMKLKSDIETAKAKQEVQVEESEEDMQTPDEVENPFTDLYAPDEDGPADADAQISLDVEDEPVDEASLEADYNLDMEDTPDSELQAMLVAQNLTSMSHLKKSFAMGRYTVKDGACKGGRRNGDHCTSRATCRRGYVAIECNMQGKGGGTYTSYRGRHCYARGSWVSKRNTKAVAVCVSRRKWKHVIRRNSRVVRGGSKIMTATARCPRNWKTLGCTCHSYWMSCGSKAGGFKPTGNKCVATMKGKNRRTWGRVYAICGRKNMSQRKPRRRRLSTRRKPHPMTARKKYLRRKFLARLRRYRAMRKNKSRKGRRGGKNPLDEMERTLNRVDRSLRSMERQLKSIQRHR